MATLPPEEHHSFPASQALQLVEIVKRWQITAEELLGELGLSEKALEEPGLRLPLATMRALYGRARMLTGEPGLGFYLGLQKRATVYGFLGFAVMNAGSLREALQLAIKYTPVVTTGLDLRLREEGDVACLILEDRADFGDVHDIALFSLLLGIWQIANALTGRELRGTADVALPKPDYFPRFAHLVPDVRFNQPFTQILFDAANLELPLVMPDRAAMRLAREQCQRELIALGFNAAIVERVRRALPKPDGFRSFDEVAGALHLSPRTLKRRLAAQKTSFSMLLDGERCEKALLLLRSPDLSLQEITERLGYSTVPNFVRAFRRWTGETPAAHRRASHVPLRKRQNGESAGPEET